MRICYNFTSNMGTMIDNYLRKRKCNIQRTSAVAESNNPEYCMTPNYQKQKKRTGIRMKSRRRRFVTVTALPDLWYGFLEFLLSACPGRHRLNYLPSVRNKIVCK